MEFVKKLNIYGEKKLKKKQPKYNICRKFLHQ